MSEKIANRVAEKFANRLEYFNTKRVLDSGNTLRAEYRDPYVNPANVSLDDLVVLAKHASEVMDKQLMEYNFNAAKESAIELTLRSFANGKFDGKVDANGRNQIFNLMGSTKTGGIMNKTAKFYTERLDAIANQVRSLVANGKLHAKYGFQLEMALDKVSDALEAHGRKAKTLENGTPAEKYMDDFGEDPATKQQDADEAYMKDFHNGGQNVVSEAYDKGDLKLPPRQAKLNAQALAAKRNSGK